MTQQVWNIIALLGLALVVFVVLRWQIGRRLRWRKRLEHLSQERAIWAMTGVYPRRERRWRLYRPDGSIYDTPLDAPLDPDTVRRPWEDARRGR